MAALVQLLGSTCSAPWQHLFSSLPALVQLHGSTCSAPWQHLFSSMAAALVQLLSNTCQSFFPVLTPIPWHSHNTSAGQKLTALSEIHCHSTSALQETWSSLKICLQFWTIWLAPFLFDLVWVPVSYLYNFMHLPWFFVRNTSTPLPKHVCN